MGEYKDQRKEIVEDLIACKQAFTEANIPWVITDGVILGYGRMNDILPWDTDLDIGVFVELSDEEWQTLYTSLNKHGFIFPNDRNDFVHCIRKAEFGIGFFHKDKTGEYYEAFPASTPGLKFVEKALWHDEHQMVEFLGDIYPIPNNVDDYLSCRYGDDWKTNIVKDAEQFFVYKRGGRDQSTWVKGRCGKTGNLWPKIIRTTEYLGTD